MAVVAGVFFAVRLAMTAIMLYACCRNTWYLRLILAFVHKTSVGGGGEGLCVKGGRCLHRASLPYHGSGGKEWNGLRSTFTFG